MSSAQIVCLAVRHSVVVGPVPTEPGRVLVDERPSPVPPALRPSSASAHRFGGEGGGLDRYRRRSSSSDVDVAARPRTNCRPRRRDWFSAHYERGVKDRPGLAGQRNEPVVAAVALIEPVMMFVWGDALPRQAVDAGRGDRRELLITAEVVADVVVGDGSAASRDRARLLHEQHDRHAGTAPRPKHLAAFTPRLLTAGALVPPKVVDVDVVELAGQRVTDAGCRVAVEPAAVGDEADDPARRRVRQPVAGPADRADIGVV